MARPKKDINIEDVKKLAGLNCSVEEIADFFEVGRRTIQRRFGAALKIGRSKGKISLKRRMWETAMSNNTGSVTMQIWLSKQMLGYTDKVEEKIHNVTDQPIICNLRWADETSADRTPNAVPNPPAEANQPKPETI